MDIDHNLTGVKRKRATRSFVNYADIADLRIFELELDEYLRTENESDEDTDDDVPYGDSLYGSSRKTTKCKNGKAKKRARFTAQRPKKPEKPFPFLSLPAELRDYIYDLALVEPAGITVVSKFKGHRRIPARGPVVDGHQTPTYRGHYYRQNGNVVQQDAKLSPNLLAVNKQIHDEGVGYLYQQPIILEDTTALHLFVASIGRANGMQLRDLVVRGWGTGRGIHKAMNFAALTLLAGCTNLKSLQFDCMVVYWGRSPQQLARQIYRDGHHFVEAYAAANGGLDAALSIIKIDDRNFERYGNATAQSKEKFKDEMDYELRSLLGR